MKMSSDNSVCVVTHPITHASEPAIDGLLEVISAVASVSLITANLPEDSDVWDRYQVSEVSDEGMGDSILTAALRFILNQIRMCREISEQDEEIILFFGSTSYVLPILFSHLLGKRVILEPRGNVPDSLYRVWDERLPSTVASLLSRPVWILERIGYASADAIVTLSPSMADDLGLRRYEAKLHENGARPVDTERFRPTNPYNDRQRKIGYLGRLDEEKGVDVLTEVVKHLPKNITFVFIGDGALRSHIEDELSGKIDRGEVVITGWIDHDEVPKYLNDLRLLVMTSRTEGVPTTALEAMACGTPVCATPVGGIPDVVKEDETGFLLEDDDPVEISSRLESIMQRDDLREISENSRLFVEDNYDFQVVADRYDSILSF